MEWPIVVLDRFEDEGDDYYGLGGRRPIRSLSEPFLEHRSAPRHRPQELGGFLVARGDRPAVPCGGLVP